MKTLTYSQIKEQYPEQWVLIGDPELSDPEVHGSILSKLVHGVVLFASKDKREIGYRAKNLRKNVEKTACIFTGEIPKNRMFLL